jgi:hypothetical protein
MADEPENLTQLHDRITVTLGDEVTRIVRKEAWVSKLSVEEIIDKALKLYCEIEDAGRNLDLSEFGV